MQLGRVLGPVLASLVIAFSPIPAEAGKAGNSPDANEAPAGNESASRLGRGINALIRDELSSYTSAGVKVVSLERGDTLYEHNPRLLLVPASNQKIFTAAAALALLGKDTEVTTSVALDAGRNALYLKGCGDSLLTPWELAKLAQTAAPKLEQGKTYQLAGDLTCFDNIYWGKGWMWDDEPDTDEMYLTPLSVNFNSVSVLVKPGAQEGSKALVEVSPPTSLVGLENQALTGRAGEPTIIAVDRIPGDRSNIIKVSGTIPVDRPPLEKRQAIWRPELLALELFRDALRAQGITVTGSTTAATPPGAQVIARRSRTVGEMVKFMMKKSDNLSAESLLKLLAHENSGKPGSSEAGSYEVRKFLQARQVPTEHIVVADGSGVSRYNLANAETFTAVLKLIYQDRDLYPLIRDALPVAGRDGTMAGRLIGTVAEGNLRAKTGNMAGVSALSGYVQSAEGEPLAFSIIIQNFAGSGRQAREIQDRIGTLLAEFRR